MQNSDVHRLIKKRRFCPIILKTGIELPVSPFIYFFCLPLVYFLTDLHSGGWKMRSKLGKISSTHQNANQSKIERMARKNHFRENGSS